MSTPDLERVLARRGDVDVVRLSIPEALAFRNAGNIPDEGGRTLRLVLHVSGPGDLESLNAKRLLYEPDYHEAPAWRRPGSKPVNVIPLRGPGVPSDPPDAWWEQPALRALEDEWAHTGTVAGVAVPAAYRGFVYKTALSLRDAGIEVTAETLADSIARWVPAEEAAQIRAALREANP